MVPIAGLLHVDSDHMSALTSSGDIDLKIHCTKGATVCILYMKTIHLYYSLNEKNVPAVIKASWTDEGNINIQQEI